jgi:pilus assembly protein Flp/PilA
MLHLIQLVTTLRQDSRGVTALEYGLIAGAIALAIVGSVVTLGGTIASVFGGLAASNW